MQEPEIVGTHVTGRGPSNAVRQLFEEDGTVYLVTGFFTATAYYELRDDVVSFLDRSPDNELVLVVGTGADQFSPIVARDLWSIDDHGQVRIYRYPHGFLHAKLYARTGPPPTAIVGSANLTRVAFEQNLEMSAVVRGDSSDDPRIRPYLDWIEDLLAVCEPLRRRDLFAPLRYATTLRNWANKGRLISRRHAAFVSLRSVVFFAVVAWLLFGL